MKAFSTAVIATALTFSVQATDISTPALYSNMVWGVSTRINSISTCSEMRLSAIGDLNHTFTLAINGYLTCPASNLTFTLTGTAYFRNDNSLVMNLSTGRATTFECVLSPSFNGSCDYYFNPAEFLGTVALTWR